MLMSAVSKLRVTLSRKSSLFKKFLPYSTKGGQQEEPRIPEVKEPTYELLDLIGEGGFSSVHIARKRGNKSYACKYAVKVCDVLRSQEEPGGDQDHTERKRVRAEILENLKKAFDTERIKRMGWDLFDDDTSDKKEAKQDKEDDEDEVELRTPWEQITDELRILLRVQRCPHVIRLVDAFLVVKSEDDKKVWFVMERLTMSLEDMITLLSRNRKLGEEEREKNGLATSFSIPTICCTILQVLKALKALKQRRVVHCDIKPGNILMSRVGRVKLCDFGIAKTIEEAHHHAEVRNVEGTPQYMASEMVKVGQRFDYSADIWSLGVVVFNMYEGGKMPWRSRDQFFQHYMWESWAISNERYFSNVLASGFLNEEEYVADMTARKGSIEPIFIKLYNGYHRRIEAVSSIVRRAMIPRPKHGPDGSIQRQDLLDRLTLEEFVEWAEEKIKRMSELQRRAQMQKAVMKILANRDFHGRSEKKRKTTRKELKLRITL